MGSPRPSASALSSIAVESPDNHKRNTLKQRIQRNVEHHHVLDDILVCSYRIQLSAASKENRKLDDNFQSKKNNKMRLLGRVLVHKCLFCFHLMAKIFKQKRNKFSYFRGYSFSILYVCSQVEDNQPGPHTTIGKEMLVLYPLDLILLVLFVCGTLDDLQRLLDFSMCIKDIFHMVYGFIQEGFLLMFLWKTLRDL